MDLNPCLRFLGYELQACENQIGTRWLRHSVPRDAVGKVVAKVEQATTYPQAPEYDVFSNVNAVVRGWMNYYRYAHNTSVTGGKLSMVIYWQTVHYLAKRHRCSIAKVMKDHCARDPKTGCLGLYVNMPAQPEIPENRYFIWHKTPTRLGLGAGSSHQVQDEQAYIDRNWAKGRSLHKKLETKARAHQRCEHCGRSDTWLYVHHPNRLVKAKRVNKGMGHVVQSGLEQKTVLLCRNCHTTYHAKS